MYEASNYWNFGVMMSMPVKNKGQNIFLKTSRDPIHNQMQASNSVYILYKLQSFYNCMAPM